MWSESDVLQTLPLTHGFLASNDHGVSIVDDSVADGISQQWVRQLFRPSRGVKLGTEDRGVSLVPGLHDLVLSRIMRKFVCRLRLNKVSRQWRRHPCLCVGRFDGTYKTGAVG